MSISYEFALKLIQKIIRYSYGYSNTINISLLLLEKITSCGRVKILASPTASLPAKYVDALPTAVLRLLKSEPIQYILETTEFYGFDFFVNNSVLIPRPETEVLVEEAVKWLTKSADLCRGIVINIVDVGTGSGCIIIALAKQLAHKQKYRFYATDISASAIKVARTNAKKHRVSDKISFRTTGYLPQIAESNRWHLVLANLPYISAKDYQKLTRHIKLEPKIALVPGKTGLEAYELLFKKVSKTLDKDGICLIETTATQAQIEKIASKHMLKAERVKSTIIFRIQKLH